MEQHALSILNTRFKDENAVRIVHPNLNSNFDFGKFSYGLLGELSATHSPQQPKPHMAYDIDCLGF